MNQILIYEPVWHDRSISINDKRIMKDNEVTIQHKDFPTPYYMSGDWAREFPLEPMETKYGTIMVRRIPISELEKEIVYV